MSDDQRYEQLSRLERSLGAARSGAGALSRGLRTAGRNTRRSVRGLRSATTARTRRGHPLLARAGKVTAPARKYLRPVVAAVSPLGWGVLVVVLVAWLLGWLLGWPELLVVAAAGLLVLVLCALLTLGRTRLTVRVELSPRRVVAGNPAAGRLLATNASRARLLPVLLELPIGVSRAQFPLRRLRMGEVQEELFSLATTRRGIVPVGPATTVRGDPFGLVRRTVPWSEVIELIVHPITVGIESLGAGVLRDLEGQTTNDTSTSDLAFHTLREYAPGDDRRYIHWRSSARASALSGESTLLVRQFLDTRRSHLAAIVDGRAGKYLDDIDFETAISAAASVVRRAFTDDVDTSVLAAQCSLYSGNLALALDTFARAELGTDVTLSSLATQAAQLAPDTTVALLVTGAGTEFGELQHAAMQFAPEVNVVALRVDPTQPAGITGLHRLVVLSLPQLSGLRALLVGGTQ
jgi:uncharacterized protein (DUF58 family)